VTRIVLKLGGRVAADGVDHAKALQAAGNEVVLVHGGGPQIDAELRARGLPVRFVRGRRFTDERTLAVVRSSLVTVGAELASVLGTEAVQLVGDEIGLQAEPVPELGLVGVPLPCRPAAVEAALARGLLPVVTPVAEGPLNVNADEAAAALAEGLRADRLAFVTDVPGVLLDGSVVARLGVERADELLATGAVDGGIVPKLLAAVRAARSGVAAEIGATAVVA